jgi:opacity protein-like surface antigen
MKKFGFFGVLTALFAGASTASYAAYPVYNGYNGQANVGYNAQPNIVRQATNNGRVVYLPTVNGNVVATNSIAAAQPTRVTGMLPHVGSSAVNAGRRYYQSEDFDRLADSGLYIGLSAAYTASVIGEITADYTGEEGAYMVPGAFQGASLFKDTIIPLQISLGAAINSDLRIDFSYSRYSDISYPQSVQTSDGSGGYVTATATGGAITSNVTLLNLYYNIDSYTGFLAGGSLRPYVGAGVGVALNTTADYVVFDGTFYSEADPSVSNQGDPTGVSDISAYHNGGTNEQLAFGLEGGVSTELGNGMKLDLFVRYMHMGKVKSSGSIVLTQDEWIATGDGGETSYPTVAHYTNWTESANLNTVDIGARLRLQF